MTSRSALRALVIPAIILMLLSPLTPVEAGYSYGGVMVLASDGDLYFKMYVSIDGPEAEEMRRAADSTIYDPFAGLQGTGNGDGMVDEAELKAYILRGESKDARWLVNERIVEVSIDGDVVAPKVREVSITSGPMKVTDPVPISIFFDLAYDLDLEGDGNDHDLRVVQYLTNSSLQFTLRSGGDWKVVRAEGSSTANATLGGDKLVTVDMDGAGFVDIKVEAPGDDELELYINIIVAAIVLMLILSLIIYDPKKGKQKRKEAEHGKGRKRAWEEE